MTFFYKKTPTSSLDQFSKDFGDFPPKPLGSMMSNNKFDIISLSGLGGKYYTISRAFRVSIRDPKKETDPKTKAIIDEFNNIKSGLATSFRELKYKFSKLNFFKKTIVFMCYLFLLPILLIIVLGSLLKVIYSISKIKPVGTGSLGFFSPKNQDKSEIVLMAKAIKKSKISRESILSHEHVHLMQSAVFQKNIIDFIDADFKINVKKFLNSNDLKSKMTLYYLSLDEVEARLHEIVLSYYREHGNLPVDYKGFLSLILACEVLGQYASSTLSEHGVVLPEHTLSKYQLREVAPAEDILFMFTYFENGLYAKRFICEALSVMYGNLLFIYGDREKAVDYLHTIECQDFYDQIYGKYAAPVMRIKDLYELEG